MCSINFCCCIKNPLVIPGDFYYQRNKINHLNQRSLFVLLNFFYKITFGLCTNQLIHNFTIFNK